MNAQLAKSWTRENRRNGSAMKLCVRLFALTTYSQVKQFVVYASPAVADYLIKEESHGLLPEIEMFISKQVQVKTEQYYNQEQFDVVVM